VEADIDQHRQVLADVRARGYGVWRFDDAHGSLHDRVAGRLASLNTALESAQHELTLGLSVRRHRQPDLRCGLADPSKSLAAIRVNGVLSVSCRWRPSRLPR
jgi:hypothetical protein